MKKMQFLVFLGLLNIGCGFSGCKPTDESPVKEQRITVEYVSVKDKFPNPERGFYKYSACNLGTGDGVISEYTLNEYRKSNISLLFRYFYIKDFRNKPLSEKALSDFDRDMEAIRKGGMKCIVRFAYSSSMDMVKDPDAPLETILMHLDQLKPHFEKNVDVIAVLQAGFIGAWGEWYYTAHGLNQLGPQKIVLEKCLEALPESRMVQVRQQEYKKKPFQRTTPLTEAEAFSGTNFARVGHHNDCFLASYNDYGTYLTNDIEAEKTFLNKDCLYVPNGGETCPPSGIDPADGLKAYNEMRRLRFTFLNEDYYRDVNDKWKNDVFMDSERSFMDVIICELGYRFELISGEYTTDVSPGSSFSAQIKLKNVGFASLFNERPVELILKHTLLSDDIYKLQLPVEPRLWKPDMERVIDVKAGIPANMPAGQYKLYLNLPDKAETLQNNPAYSVRFANKDVWEASTGYNNLLVTINVEENKNAKPYSGELYFGK